MSGVISGTAILKITKNDSKWVPYYVEFEQVKGGGEMDHEEFSLLETDTLPCPDAAYDISIGESVSVEVDYELFYSEDYMGETDVELTYNRQEVITVETGE